MISEKIINRILEAATDAGADFAEVFAENKYNTTISMNNNSIDNGVVSRDFGIGIRVFFGTNSAYTYTSDLDEEKLIKLTKNICASYKNEKNIVIPDRKILTGIEKSIITAEKHFSKIDYARKVDLMKAIVSSGRNYDDAISRMHVNYLDQEQKVIIANTEGLYKEDDRYKTRFLISAFAQKDGDTRTGYVGPGAMRGFEYYDNFDVDHYAHEAARSAMAMVGADYCKAGQMSVIIENGFGGLMVHEACGHSLEACRIANNNSEFCGKVGQKVASDLVTLVDDGSIENEWGSLNIDDEGSKTQKNVLIEKGVLKTFMTDKLSAKKLGTESTGSGRRESYKYAPTSRMTNTYIDKGESTRDEIFSNTEHGLYVKVINAGSVNSVTGEFNFSVLESYMVENGKITKPVKGATLIGKGGEVLKRIDMVGDNLKIGQGYCFAESGALYIGAGQPTVRISNMTVGGRD